MIIIDLIKELMFQQNRSISDIAEATNLPYLFVENIVVREVVPTPEHAKLILNELGVTLEEVLMLY